MSDRHKKPWTLPDIIEDETSNDGPTHGIDFKLLAARLSARQAEEERRERLQAQQSQGGDDLDLSNDLMDEPMNLEKYGPSAASLFEAAVIPGPPLSQSTSQSGSRSHTPSSTQSRQTNSGGRLPRPAPLQPLSSSRHQHPPRMNLGSIMDGLLGGGGGGNANGNTRDVFGASTTAPIGGSRSPQAVSATNQRMPIGTPPHHVSPPSSGFVPSNRLAATTAAAAENGHGTGVPLRQPPQVRQQQQQQQAHHHHQSMGPPSSPAPNRASTNGRQTMLSRRMTRLREDSGPLGRRGGRGGGGGGRRNGHGGDEDEDELSDRNLIVQSMLEPYANLLSVSGADRRPADDIGYISDHEKIAADALIRREHAFWMGLDPTNIRDYFVDELKAVNHVVNETMRQIASASGAQIVPGMLTPGRTSANANNGPVLFSDAEMQEREMANSTDTGEDGSFNLTPANVILTRLKLAIKIREAHGKLIWNSRGDEDDPNYRRDIESMVAETLLCIDGVMTRTLHWLQRTGLNRDMLSTAASELSSLQAQLVMDNPKSALILLLSTRLKASMLRRGAKPKWLYIERWADIADPTGQQHQAHGGMVNRAKRTHYWEPICTIATWIKYETSLLFGANQLPIWIQVNESCSVEYLAHYFEKADEFALPTVTPSPSLFSFKNGLFNLQHNMWIPYGSQLYMDQTATATYAHNFFSTDFPHDNQYYPDTGNFNYKKFGRKYDPVTKRRTNDPVPDGHWSQIWVEGLSPFLKANEFSDEVIEFILFALCRYLFRRSADQFQFDLFLHGKAGVGKTKLIEQLMYCHPKELQGVIPTKIEQIFGLQDFLNDDGTPSVSAAYCNEINRQFQLPSGQLNILVEGARAAVAVKRGHVKVTHDGWEIPIIVAGNTWFFYPPEEIPGVARRWLTIVVKKRPTPDMGSPPNPALYERAAGHYIKKLACAYFEKRREQAEWARSSEQSLREKANDVYIWNLCPQYFYETRSMVLKGVSKTMGMISDPQWLVRTGNKDDVVTIQSLEHALKLYKIARCSEDPATATNGYSASIEHALESAMETNVYDATVANPVVCELTQQKITTGRFVRGFKYGPSEAMRQGIRDLMASRQLENLVDLTHKLSMEMGSSRAAIYDLNADGGGGDPELAGRRRGAIGPTSVGLDGVNAMQGQAPTRQKKLTREQIEQQQLIQQEKARKIQERNARKQAAVDLVTGAKQKKLAASARAGANTMDIGDDDDNYDQGVSGGAASARTGANTMDMDGDDNYDPGMSDEAMYCAEENMLRQYDEDPGTNGDDGGVYDNGVLDDPELGDEYEPIRDDLVNLGPSSSGKSAARGRTPSPAAKNGGGVPSFGEVVFVTAEDPDIYNAYARRDKEGEGKKTTNA